MLKQRIITAIILSFVFLAVLFGLPSEGFSAFLAIVVAVAAWEWSHLSGFDRRWQRALYILITLLVMAACGYWAELHNDAWNTDALRALLLCAVAFWGFALLWVQSYPSSALLWSARPLRLIMGLFVLVPTWLSVTYIHARPSGEWLLLLMMVSVATADTGGYFVGRRFGRYKLAASVSPGKTIEGFLGGLCSNALLAALVWWLTHGHFGVIASILMATSLASVLGDLLESMVKRHRGVKDSGQLLPGHGGILDRIDGITAAAPVFALGVLLSGWQL